MNGLDVLAQARYFRHALQAALIVIGADRQRVCPPFRLVVDCPQTAQTRHGGRVREPEVVRDVTSADVYDQARRRVSAERDAAQRSRLVFHGSENVRWRQRTGVAVRHHNSLHPRCNNIDNCNKVQSETADFAPSAAT